jgi:hypothetical protein
VVEAAFEELEDEASELLIDGSGLRELRIGKDRFGLVPGAALGRYAIDDQGCGFDPDDLDEIESALGNGKGKDRLWLVAWNAPAGWGLTRGRGNTEVGSPELQQLAQRLGVQGGLFAYPETQVFSAGKAPDSAGLALVVPRLGRTGAQRSDGGFVPPTLATLMVGESGLVAAP